MGTKGYKGTRVLQVIKIIQVLQVLWASVTTGTKCTKVSSVINGSTYTSGTTGTRVTTGTKGSKSNPVTTLKIQELQVPPFTLTLLMYGPLIWMKNIEIDEDNGIFQGFDIYAEENISDKDYHMWYKLNYKIGLVHVPVGDLVQKRTKKRAGPKIW